MHAHMHVNLNTDVHTYIHTAERKLTIQQTATLRKRKLFDFTWMIVNEH